MKTLICILLFLVSTSTLQAEEINSSETPLFQNRHNLYYDLAAHGKSFGEIVTLSEYSHIQKVTVLGLQLYAESRPGRISMDPRDGFDPRGAELRKISAERLKYSADSHFYRSGDDGFGYELKRNCDVGVKDFTVRFNVRF